jgi:rhamnosyltransferase subunit B
VKSESRVSNAPRRALLTWEIGGGGHFRPTLRLAAALKHLGLHVDFAALRPHALTTAENSFDRLFQAPVLPRTTRLGRQFGAQGRPAVSYVEILMDYEFDQPLVVHRQVEAWRSLFDLIRPEILITDFSPGAVLAARGRIPTVAFGSPFCVPCGSDGRFPSFLPEHPASIENEAVVRTSICTALDELGEPPVNDLVEAVVAPTRFPQGFSELDPYAAIRTEELLPPIVEQCTVENGSRSEILAFLPRTLKTYPAIIDTLVRLGQAVCLDGRRMTPDIRRRLGEAGVRFGAEILDSNAMASSASLVLSHGGFHTVVRGLLAGVPQIIVAGDQEKYLHLRALQRLGVGTGVTLDRLTSETLGEAIETVTSDPAYASRARALGVEFRRRHVDGTIETIAERIASLVTA